MPRGFKTQNGPRPGYASTFGMVEDSSLDYPPRTEANVKESDATLRIARTFKSAGEQCTLRAILKYKRPHLGVSAPIGRIGSEQRTKNLSAVVRWIVHLRLNLGRPIVLNVAGNSERTAPGIGEEAEAFLGEVFDFLVLRSSDVDT